MIVHIFGPMPISDSITGHDSPCTAIFVDAGIQHISLIPPTKLLNLAWIGDHDGLAKEKLLHYSSLFEELSSELKSREGQGIKIDFSPDKDHSDLKLALDWLLRWLEETQLLKEVTTKEQQLKIFFHGLSGGDLAHQLAILGEIHTFLKVLPHTHCRLFDKSNRPIIEAHGQRLMTEAHGQLSLFSLEEQTVELKGMLKYKGKHQLAPLSSLGLSNEASGAFEVHGQKPIFIIKR